MPGLRRSGVLRSPASIRCFIGFDRSCLKAPPDEPASAKLVTQSVAWVTGRPVGYPWVPFFVPLGPKVPQQLIQWLKCTIFINRLRAFRQAVLWGRWCCGCSCWGCFSPVVVVDVLVARCRCFCSCLFPGKACQEPFWCVYIAFGTLGCRFRSPWGLLRVTLGVHRQARGALGILGGGLRQA